MKSASLNHIYRLVWSAASNAWVAVAENTSARGKRSSATRQLAAALLAVAFGSAAGAAWAGGTLPTGGAITAGTGSITQSGTQMVVTQTSGRMVANWNSFDIGSNAGVQFVQPGAGSIALNRVVGGGGPSQILGNLSANGQVWLLNPGGVVFGKGAQVNVGGLVASSLNIGDADFLEGKARFTGGATGGAVINQGDIKATGGVVALIGSRVENSGTISAPGGSVAMAAGDAVSLDFDGDGLVSVNVDRGVLDALVSNEGQISADGGSVLLSARAADAAISSVVNNTGTIEARSLVSRNGRIVLDNDAGNGTTAVSGTLDVSSAAGTGGEIDVTGKNITVNNATLNASGATGGGTIKVGGGLHGADTGIANAQNVTTGSDVNVYADATNSGDGGTVTFWADNRNDFAGNIFIRGGAQGGDGGLAEVSGKQSLRYAGMTHALATRGLTGILLLDPDTIEVYGGSDPGDGASSGWDSTTSTGDMKIYEKTLEAQETNVALLAKKGITFEDLTGNGGDGTISMKNNVSFYAEVVDGTTSGAHPIEFMNAANTLEVFGTGYIFIEAGGSGTGTIGEPQSGGSNVTGNYGVFNLIAHGSLADGAVNLAPANMPAHVVKTGGTPYALGDSYLQAHGAQAPGAGSITVAGADGLAVSGSLTTDGGYIHISGDADSGGVGNLIINKNITTNGGNFYMSFGTSSNGATATLAPGSVVNLACTTSTCTQSGRLYTGADITAAGGSTAQSMGDSTGKVILGGTLVVGGDLALNNYVIEGGADIQTDGKITLNSTDTMQTTTNPNDAAHETLTNVALQGSGIAIDSTPAGLNTVDLQLKPSNASDNMFLNQTDGVVIGDGTVNRDGSVNGQTVRSTFISEADLGKLQAAGVKSLIIGRPDGTGTTEVESGTNGRGATVTPGFAFDAPNQLGLINGDIVLNGPLSNSTGSVVVQATNARTGIDTAGTMPSAGTAWVAGTADNDVITGNVTMTSGGTVAAGGDIVASSENGNFVNDRGTDAFQPGTGRRWLTYSQSPDMDVTGGLTYDFKSYNAAWLDADGGFAQADGTYGHDASGNFVDLAPDTRLIDGMHTLSEILGTATTANNFAANATVSGKLYKVAPTVEATFVGGVTKTYDGTTGLTNTTVTYQDGTTGSALTVAGNVKVVSNGIDGDNVQVAVSQAGLAGAQYSDKNANPNGSVTVDGTTVTVANGKTVSATGVTIGTATNGGDSNAADDNVAGQQIRVYGYNLSGGTGDVGATGGAIQGDIGVIKQATVTVSGTASDKVYDGTTSATLSNLQATGVFAGDAANVAVAGSGGTFDDKNVGTGKSVYGNGLTLTGAEAGNYVIDNSGPVATASITPKSITASATVVDKVYDGTTTAQLSNVALAGLVAGDSVSASGSVGNFDSKNVGTGKAVDLSGLSLAGADAGNYVLDTSAAVVSGTIRPKTVTVTATASDKVYDGTTAAQLSNVSVSGLVAGDSVSASGSTGSFDTKNAGTGKAVDGSGLSLAGADAGNYVLDTSAQVATAAITPKSVTATATASDKVYDGATTAQLSNVVLAGLVRGDSVSASGSTGNFDTKNAGTGKAVDGSGLSLAGADAGNYVLDGAAQVATAAITPKSVTVTATASDKVYDGNTAAQLSNAKPTATDVVSGDDLSIVGGTGAFDDKNAGSGKAVYGAGFSLSGADAGNYVLDNSGPVATASITPKPIGATATVTGKTYDGNSTAQLSNVALNTGDIVAGDDLGVTGGDGSFGDPNVGIGKPVYGSGLSLTGADKGNYVLDMTAEVGKGDIMSNYSPVALVAPAQGVNGTASSEPNASGSGNHTAGNGIGSVDLAQQSAAGLFDWMQAGNVRPGAGDANAVTTALDTSIVNANGWTSLALNQQPEEPALRSTLVLFRAQSADKLDNKGTFAVIDHGNNIALEGVADFAYKTPEVGASGGDWVSGLVARADGQLMEMRVRLLNDGTLLVDLPSDFQQQRDEDAASYGLAVAKKRLGVHVNAVKAVVLESSTRRQG